MNTDIMVKYSPGKGEYTLRPIFQYDHGRMLKLAGIDKTATVQVHYAIENMTNALVDIPTNKDEYWISRIPFALTSQPFLIHAYAYISTKESGITVMKINIPVTPREKQDDYEYTEEELKNLDFVLSQLEEANKRTDAAANEAKSAAFKIDNMTVEAESLLPGSEATAKITEKNGVKNIVFGIPSGIDSGSGDIGIDNLGESLKIVDGKIEVNTVDSVIKNNSLPITSAAVFTEVGNINELLKLI